MAGGKASKTKGSTGEREACKILGEILGGSFIRSPGSGAFVGGKNAFRKGHLSAGQTRTFKGDVISPDDLPRLILESKSYLELAFHQLISAKTCPQLDEWIGQTLETIDPGDLSIILIKITRIGWFACVPVSEIPFVYGNHADYTGKHGRYRITDMVEFFTRNRDLVRQESAAA